MSAHDVIVLVVSGVSLGLSVWSVVLSRRSMGIRRQRVEKRMEEQLAVTEQARILLDEPGKAKDE